MKKNIFLVLISLLVLSCEKDDASCHTSIMGTWKVVEILADPGDGSGTFMPFEGNRTMTFLESGIVRTNAYFCNVYEEMDQIQEANYSLSDSTISMTCEDFERNMSFNLDCKNLIVYNPCFEPCADKYVKISE